MASREEVFQKKVLGKLYAVPPKSAASRSPRSDAGFAVAKPHLAVKAEESSIADAGNACQRHRRLYTAHPPPPDYVANDKGPEPLPDDGAVNTDVPPADENEEVSEGECGGRRRRRKRVRKAGGGGARDGAESQAVRAAGGKVTPPTAGEETKLSRNKKRKLKKKRRKEKLLTLGLTPSAAALQFIYQPEEGGREDEAEVLMEDTHSNETQMAEVLEFLQATLKVCGRSTPEGEERDLGPWSGAQALLDSLLAREVPLPSVDLCRLWHLKSLVLLRDADRLATDLAHFQQSATMAPEEVSLICSLFRYWITDILPAFGERTAQTP